LKEKQSIAPLVCTAFNADFDQMAVHLPLGPAILEEHN
jgi:DNA-directed RNA polymerase beta' subunit